MLRETNLLLVLSLLAGPTFGQAGTCGMKCGQERWAIKTLTDNNAETVGNAASQDTTVTELIGETAPTKLTESRAPLEMKRFHLTALIIGWKIEAATSAENFGKKASASTSFPDHDFHIVIADPSTTNNQMIIEVPDPQCEAVCSSKFLAQISQVRKEVAARLGTPTDTVQPLSKPWLVDITGPAFFDFPHGQDGLAKNCIEIHPVMEITFVKQQGSEVTPHKAKDLRHICGKR